MSKWTSPEESSFITIVLAIVGHLRGFTQHFLPNKLFAWEEDMEMNFLPLD